MIFQFGIVALGAICATVLVIAGHSGEAGWMMGACVLTFFLSLM